jgi:hypothetical protein
MINPLGNYRSRKIVHKTVRNTPNKHKEDDLEEMVAKYLLTAYPRAMFHFDLGSGGKKTKFQAIRAKKLHGKWSRGYPDLFIAVSNKYYNGLFIELKSDGSSPYKKDGKLKKNEHTENQYKVHQKLRDDGYEAVFATGFKEAKEIIENYMECIL